MSGNQQLEELERRVHEARQQGIALKDEERK